MDGQRRRSSVCEPTFKGESGVVLEEVELNPRSWGCMLPLASGLINRYYVWLIRQRLATGNGGQKRVDARNTVDEDIENVMKYECVNAICVRRVSLHLEQAIERHRHITEVAISDGNKFDSLPKVPILRLSGHTSQDDGAAKIRVNLTNATKLVHVTLFVFGNKESELLELKNYFDINVEKVALSVYVKNVCRSYNFKKYLDTLEYTLVHLFVAIIQGVHSTLTNSLRVSLIFPKCSTLEDKNCKMILPLMSQFNAVLIEDQTTHCRFRVTFPEHVNLHLEVIFKAAYASGPFVCFDDFLQNSYLD